MSLLRWILLLLTGCLLAGCAGASAWAVLPDAAPPPVAAVVGDPARGAAIFQAGVSGTPPCSTCHQVTQGGSGFSLGPNLHNIAEQAGTRVEGVSARQYIEDSILRPRDFIVPGFRDMMYAGFAEHLSAQELADLIAYLLTL